MTSKLQRRDILRLGVTGVTAAQLGSLAGYAAPTSNMPQASQGAFGRARSVIVMFCWGGMSHLDTFDMKPLAGSEVRGEFNPVSTSVPGVHVTEHLPLIARQMQHLAIVRSVHHQSADHRMAAYWNLTGHMPPGGDGGVAPAVAPSRRDWPSIGAQVAIALRGDRRYQNRKQVRRVNPDEIVEAQDQATIDGKKIRVQRVTEELAANLPRTISIPYALADRGLLNGQFGGFLGLEYDPVFVHPGRGTAYKGISPNSGTIDLTPRGVTRRRMAMRGLLLDDLNSGFPWARNTDPQFRLQASQNEAMNMLLSPEVQSAFDLSKETKAMHELYGDHVAGQSTLLGRRLTDAGVPLVTVNLGVGDLNGSQGDNWDTHGNNFNRLKNDLLPPWDRAASALIEDLVQSGKIDDTLVVFMSEFGRTPQINGGAGRDHFPNCYTVLFAGAGVQGGQVIGKSDKIASRPIEAACTPKDIHATIFHALGISPRFQILDQDNRPLAMCEGAPLPVFG